MKKTKAILMALCAVLLVAASVMGTLAYLTSTASVTNTFTVGKVAITLDEAKVNVNGQKLDANNNVYEETGSVNLAARVDNNTYKLLPGHTYEKDPIIHVTAGSSDCYLFVKVENGIADIEDQNKTVDGQMKANGWLPVVVEGESGVYVLTYTQAEEVEADNNSVKSGALKVVSAANAKVDVPVFAKFKIADDVNDEENVVKEGVTVPNDRKLSKFNEKQIIVTAYAVQADGFAGKPAADIWTAAGF